MAERKGKNLDPTAFGRRAVNDVVRLWKRHMFRQAATAGSVSEEHRHALMGALVYVAGALCAVEGCTRSDFLEVCARYWDQREQVMTARRRRGLKLVRFDDPGGSRGR